MPTRIYVGRHDEVEIAATGQVVRRNESVEVDADLAKQLDAQPANWSTKKESGA